jgi:hypothetical protein
MDHRQVERVTRGLIPLAKMIPHLRRSRKSHELRGKLWQNTSSKNSRSTSILITPLSISSLSITKGGKSLREIRYLLIISIDRNIIDGLGSNPVSLRRISSKNRWCRRYRCHWSKGARRTGDLATKNTPKPKTAHVNAHMGGKIRIVGTIKSQWTARNNNIARRRRPHGDTSKLCSLPDLDLVNPVYQTHTYKNLWLTSRNSKTHLISFQISQHQYVASQNQATTGQIKARPTYSGR